VRLADAYGHPQLEHELAPSLQGAPIGRRDCRYLGELTNCSLGLEVGQLLGAFKSGSKHQSHHAPRARGVLPAIGDLRAHRFDGEVPCGRAARARSAMGDGDRVAGGAHRARTARCGVMDAIGRGRKKVTSLDPGTGFTVRAAWFPT
jgi:hypothetical protein